MTSVPGIESGTAKGPELERNNGRMSHDKNMMRRCVELAGAAKLAGNTPVGALLVIADEVVAEAAEEVPAGDDPFGHAELLVVRRALQQLRRKHLPEATLFTTVEPCFLCSFAIRESRIGRVVIGSATPDIGGATSRYPILSASDIPRWGASPTIVWGIPARRDLQ